MRFNLFSISPTLHLKRAAQMLGDARMAQLEHQAAAEHHGALAHMYRERVQRLEAEISAGPQTGVEVTTEICPGGMQDRQATERNPHGPRLQPLVSAA